MDMQLKGKTALVCGGSSGIGLGCAHALAAEGVNVVIAGRDAGRLQKAVDAIAGDGGLVRAVTVDLASPDAVTKLRAAAAAFDILLMSPGGSPAGDILTIGSGWTSGIEQIVARPMAIIEAYLPGMQAKRYGRVINITSSGVHFTNPGLAYSGALRAAMTHATANLARRVAADGITINSIAPGPVESAGLHEFFERRAKELGVSVEEVRAQRLKDTPTGRFGEAADIGAMAVFLASPYAGSITGRTLLMDGGANPFPFL